MPVPSPHLIGLEIPPVDREHLTRPKGLCCDDQGGIGEIHRMNRSDPVLAVEACERFPSRRELRLSKPAALPDPPDPPDPLSVPGPPHCTHFNNY